MADKKRFDYSLVGLVKTDHVTLFNKEGVVNLDAKAQSVCANYGLFVMLTRTLAGHENDTIQEKKDLMTKTWDWLKEGCPKREKVMVSAYDAAVKKADAFRDITLNDPKATPAARKAADKEHAETLITLAKIFGK